MKLNINKLSRAADIGDKEQGDENDENQQQDRNFVFLLVETKMEIIWIRMLFSKMMEVNTITIMKCRMTRSEMMTMMTVLFINLLFLVQ